MEVQFLKDLSTKYCQFRMIILFFPGLHVFMRYLQGKKQHPINQEFAVKWII